MLLKLDLDVHQTHLCSTDIERLTKKFFHANLKFAGKARNLPTVCGGVRSNKLDYLSRKN